MNKTYYLITLRYPPMPALKPKTLTIQTKNEERAIANAKRRAAKEWDMFPESGELMEVIDIQRTNTDGRH